jgi:hypothetical protein
VCSSDLEALQAKVLTKDTLNNNYYDFSRRRGLIV